MQKLRPYPEYRDSAVPWLGRVPTHWKTERLGKTVISCVNGIWGAEPTGFSDIACVRVADFDRTTHRVRLPIPTMRSVKASERHGRILREGDLLIEKSGGGELQPVGTVVVYGGKTEAVCSNFIGRISTSPDSDAGFLVYLHSNLYSIGISRRNIKQTTGIQNLDWKAYFSEPIALPPLGEQQAIANFLAHFDQRINRLIRTRRRQIELLNEQKQAIIHRAVTRGLDPDVPLKPSGIDWLGNIPVHWEVKSVKQLLARMDYGTSNSPDNLGKTRILSMSAIQAGEVNVSDDCPTGTVPKMLYLELNDLLFNRTNSPELVGKVGIFRGRREDRVSFASYLVRLRVNGNCSPDWLNYALNSPLFWSYARSQALTSLHQANLNSSRYGAMRIPVPPKSEQIETASHLGSVLTKLNLQTEGIRRRIDLLSELRARLVADVVAGHVNAIEHSWSLSHPEEPEVPEKPTHAD